MLAVVKVMNSIGHFLREKIAFSYYNKEKKNQQQMSN